MCSATHPLDVPSSQFETKHLIPGGVRCVLEHRVLSYCPVTDGNGSQAECRGIGGALASSSGALREAAACGCLMDCKWALFLFNVKSLAESRWNAMPVSDQMATGLPMLPVFVSVVLAYGGLHFMDMQ